MNDVPDFLKATLQERGKHCGLFKERARIAQNIKRAMRDSPNWTQIDPMMLESLEMIAHKVSRILNGDPTHTDCWHDVAGYAKLVEDELARIEKERT